MYPDMDSLLGFGKFQHFQIWVFQELNYTRYTEKFTNLYRFVI